MEELLKAFKENQDLNDKAMAMWSQGASAQETVDMLADRGVAVDVAQIEELLSAIQARRGAAIGDNC